MVWVSYIAYVDKNNNNKNTVKIIQMERADLYAEVTIKLTINQSIDSRTYNDSELLQDWIYCNVTDHNSEWKKVLITKTEITNIQD